MRHVRIPFPIVLLAALVAGACGTSHDAPTPPAAPTSAGAEETGPPLRGTAESAGALALRECGAVAGRTIALDDPHGEIRSALSGLAPASPVYLELRGSPSPDGTKFKVAKVERARGEHAGVACEPPVSAGDFVAAGTEPFWSIEILETGIVYRSPEEPKGITYPYGVTPNATGRREYASKIEGAHPSTLDVVLDPGRCLDAMSGEVFGYKARVTRNGVKLSGCAAPGVPPGGFGDAPLDELARWLGTYPTGRTWTTPPVGARLDVLLGPKAAAFRKNIEVHSPLMRDGGIYYVTGNKPHQGGLEGAIFMADPATDTINVILFTNGTREDFKEGDRTIEPPDEVKTTLAGLPPR